MLEDGSVDVVVSMLSSLPGLGPHLRGDPAGRPRRRRALGGGYGRASGSGRGWAAHDPRSREGESLGDASARISTRARRRLVQDDAWRTLVQLNPMRALHEYDWYFQSRFPALRAETLSISRRARAVAYDCGVVDEGRLAEQAYP